MLRFIALWLNCNLVGLGPRFLVLGNELCINLVDREFFRDQGRELLLDCQVSLEKALCNFASLSLRQESKELWKFGCPSIRPYVHNPKVIEAGPKRISHSALGCPTPLPRSAQPVVVQRRGFCVMIPASSWAAKPSRTISIWLCRLRSCNAKHKRCEANLHDSSESKDENNLKSGVNATLKDSLSLLPVEISKAPSNGTIFLT